MAFHDVQFPDRIAQGAQILPTFSTAVITGSGGHEQRVANWAQPRRRYNVGTGLTRRGDAAAVAAFFLARHGRLHGFRFRDWSDYALARQPIGTTDGTDPTWPIFKRYSSGGVDVDRRLTRIVSGTVSLWVDGAAIVAGGGASQYQVSLSTGIVTLGSTLTATTGLVIECACEFDVPVRFDSDEVALTQRSYEIGEWPDVPLVEIRE